MFSVLICTHNRPEMLDKCLEALVERSSEKPDQVVIVNGGDERADEVVGKYFKTSSIEISVLNTRNKNLATSRNVGMPHCSGEVIAMTDDDAEVFPDWVGQMKRAHAEHPEAGAVGGAVIGSDQRSRLSRIADTVTFPYWSRAGYVRTLPGVNISYKKSAIEAVGAQDESLFRGEDVDYNWRFLEAGYKVYYDPSIRVTHHHRATVRGFLQQHYMYGRAYVLVRRKWPEMYSVYPHRLRNWRDAVKGLAFVFGALIEPLTSAKRLSNPSDRLFAYPFLVLNEIVWRAGMVREAAFRT